MTTQGSWKLDQAACDFADERGQEVARTYDLISAPVDPFRVIEAERRLIHAAGDNFGDAFDGRLSYVGPRFLLCYNTKYDQWPHRGSHHPKVRFSVAHELGHYFLDEHRRALVLRGATHMSFTEFASSKLVERQADSFAAGLLMPRFMLGPRINREPEPDLTLVREVAAEFDVSLTSLLVRWAQLSDFPCATLCVDNGIIAWGFASREFREHGYWRVKKGSAARSLAFLKFASQDPGVRTFREGQGSGSAADWLEADAGPIFVQEFYAAIPYTGAFMVFVTASESDLPDIDDE